MRLRLPARRTFSSANAILLYIALFKLTIHLLTSTRYGYFIDELYTIACGRHPAFGYADIPPLVPALSRLSGLLLGYSLTAIRLLPALAGAATVFLVGLTARRLGGGRFAQGLAAAAVALGPVWLASNSFMAYDGFNLLMTALFFYIVDGPLGEGGEPPTRSWLLFGLAAGLGLLTKLSLLTYGFALALALLLTPQRRYYARPGIWLSGLLAMAMLSPYLVWQHLHGWPVLEYLRNYPRQVNAMSPLEFLAMQILAVNPLALPLWAAGLAFFFSARGKTFRVLGWMFVLLFLLFTTVVKVKFYFMSPAFMPLFAAGAVLIEGFSRSAARRWLRPAYTALLVAERGILGPPDAARASRGDAGRIHQGRFALRLRRRSRWAPRSRRNCPSTSPTGSAGRIWFAPWRASITVCPRRTGPIASFSGAATGKPGRWICSGRNTACPRRSAGMSLTISGVPGRRAAGS